MAIDTIETALKRFDERYYKLRIDNSILESFGNNLSIYLGMIQTAIANNESEEYLKNIVNDFLKHSFYNNNRFEINTYKRADSAIKYDGNLYAIIEMKRPSNRVEMLKEDDINYKALWEIVYYYLCESRDVTGSRVKTKFNCEIRRLIISDSKMWFLINAQDLDKLCQGYIEKLFYKFENHQLTYSDVDKFYSALQEYFESIDVTEKLRYVFFEIDKIFRKKAQWQYLYKIFRRDYLLKDGYRQISKTHVLNKNFYQELLYLMGLREEKLEGKNVIRIDRSITNSFANQVFTILTEEKEKPVDEATEETFQLVLVWINRLLFIKLFEGQLLSINGDESRYRILDNEKIHTFNEVQSLFFDILGKRDRSSSPFLDQFADIPYLNSSLFERYDIEKQDVNIREIRNDGVQKKQGSVLGKNAPNTIPLLEYVIDFLNAYSFTTLNTNVGDQTNRTTEIIDASVLGLIFEKINGYKEGSFYTKGFVTEYICQETIESLVIEKLNKEFHWHCQSIDDLKMAINTNSAEQVRRVNEIINSIHICDPAVGSGHFLVSALNRIIALKRELGVLLKYGNASPFREYDIAVIDDVLCVFDGQGREYKYDKNDATSQMIQKTLFNEKRTIIENCLFGVDINPNAVAICQLRLWIELLKNAYYENGVMETLPNIDINIKCGNSLVHKLHYLVGSKIALGDNDINRNIVRDYKRSVKKYHSESDKTEKARIKQIISQIKTKLHTAGAQMHLHIGDHGELSFIDDLEWSPNRYKDAFEWAIEFPEILSDEGVFLGFDGIIGNPPYIRVQELAHDDIDYYKKVYQTAWKRIDISTLFIELGYNLVHRDGYVSYITSNQFLTTEYGARIRNFLSERTFVTKIIEFSDLPVFDGALTYVNIFFFKKGAHIDEFSFYKVPSLPFIVPTAEQFIQIAYDDMNNDEGWVLKSKAVLNCLEKIRQSSQGKLKAYAKCWAGVITGKDPILMFDNGQPIPFEEEMTIPVIRAEGCSRYCYAQPTKRIYYPYQEKDDETELIPLVDIQSQYPQTFNYIMEHENALKGRKDSRITFGQRIGWYGLIRFGKLSRFKKKKIVSPGEVKHNKFSIDITGSAFSCARVFSITSENERVSTEYLLGFLNSELCEFYLHTSCAVKAGGFYSYSANAIDALPFIYDESIAPQVEELVNQTLLAANSGADTTVIEEQIDALFYNLFNVSEQEQKTIKQFLDM